MLKILKRNKNFLRPPKALTIIYLIFPLAIPLAKRLARTRIKPNFITFFSAPLVLVSALFFLSNSWLYLSLGALFFYLSTLLDQVDGNLARLTKQETELGNKLDRAMDSARKIICFTALLYSQFYLKGEIKLLIFGIGLVFLHYGMHFAFNLLRGREFQLTRFSRWLAAKGVYPCPFSKPDETFLIFIIGPLLNQFITVFLISLGAFFILDVLVKLKVLIFQGKGW